MKPRTATGLPLQFDKFLSAPVGQDRSGLEVSVLSTLARLDLDPWEQAAELDGLGIPAATERMQLLIGAARICPGAAIDTAKTAARLVGLLPHGMLPRGTPVPPVQLPVPQRSVSQFLLINVLAFAAMVAWHFLSGHNVPALPAQQSATPFAVAAAPGSPAAETQANGVETKPASRVTPPVSADVSSPQR